MKEILENLQFEDFNGQFKDEYDNFFVGAVLKTEKGIYLIGDVNIQLGICDDCNIKNEKILQISHINQIFK